MRALGEVQKKAEELQTEFKGIGKEADKAVTTAAKHTEKEISKMGGFLRRVAGQLKDDFKALFSIQSLAAGLKLSDQFRGSIKETVSLSDTIRRLGATFGIASKDFASFQSQMTKGFGDIGLSSEDASRALEGLANTQVRGRENLIEYAKAAGMLASVSGAHGAEADISKGLAGVVKARGGDVNDPSQMRAVAAELVKIQQATGMKTTDALASLESLLAAMPQDMRKSVGIEGLTKLITAGAVGGPGSAKFLEELISKSPIARKALEAQGFGKVMGKGGLDVEAFRKSAGAILGRVGGDPRMAAQTLGISEEAAEGFVRLYESLDKVAEAQKKVQESAGDLGKAYSQGRSLGDSFRASINRVKSMVSGPLSQATQGLTDVLGKASESDAGALLATTAAATAAAVLTGGGLRGAGKALGLGGMAKGAAIEGITGRQVQPVYVVNASEIGGGAAGLLGGGKGGALASVGKYIPHVAAAAGGAYLGKELSESKAGKAMWAANPFTQLIDAAVTAVVAKQTGVGFGDLWKETQKGRDRDLNAVLNVELKSKDLKVSRPNGRGAGFGPTR